MRLEIESHSHPYVVETLPDLRTALAVASGELGVFVLADRHVRDLYPETFAGVEAQNRLLTLPATEEQKTYEALAPVFQTLIDRGLRRNMTLCVVGGGVIQDIGCFIASILYRGMRWELIPTTLLAQCDSCIGSKSSLNVGMYKNQIGTFYPPHRVLLVVSVLRTLSLDAIRSGLGEAIKLHLVAGGDAFNTLKERLRVLPVDPVDLDNVIKDSLLIKKDYIEKDEYDHGIRNLLNYGHTFGHAYESTTGYAIPHGIAVTLGVSTATYLSVCMGWVDRKYFDEINAFLRLYFEPYQLMLSNVSPEAIRKVLAQDKKNTGIDLTCILTRGAGRMEKCVLNLEEHAMPWLQDWRRIVVGSSV